MTETDEKRVESSERFCPRYQRAVEIVGRRWSGAVLRAMLAGASRFGEIQEAIPDLSNRMLSERLRELEVEGIVERVVVPERPVRIEYRLTEKGRALHSVVDGLSRWAEEWIEPEDLDPDGERPAERA
jgi:DNA-binding HxlR family transcriptional regulator